MRSPRIPPMLTTLVQGALFAFDGTAFDSPPACPACGGTTTGYDTRRRQFATLHDGDTDRTIAVSVKRFTCRSCGKLCSADEPFYPATRIGSPVVDLCIAFSGAMGYGRAARNLSVMGVVIDRMQCRHYAQAPVGPVPLIHIFGFPVPQSIVSLSSIAAGIDEGGRINGAEALAACGFPSAHRAALHGASPRQEGDQRDEQKGDKERDAHHPEDEREHQ